jgi:hypothetical protein
MVETLQVVALLVVLLALWTEEQELRQNKIR